MKYHNSKTEVMEEVLRSEIKRLETEKKRLLIALHDAIKRPMGVVPDSALEFYDANKEKVSCTTCANKIHTRPCYECGRNGKPTYSEWIAK